MEFDLDMLEGLEIEMATTQDARVAAVNKYAGPTQTLPSGKLGILTFRLARGYSAPSAFESTTPFRPGLQQAAFFKSVAGARSLRTIAWPDKDEHLADFELYTFIIQKVRASGAEGISRNDWFLSR